MRYEVDATNTAMAVVVKTSVATVPPYPMESAPPAHASGVRPATTERVHEILESQFIRMGNVFELLK